MLAGHGGTSPACPWGATSLKCTVAISATGSHSVVQAVGGYELKPGVEQDNLFYVLS